MFLKLFVTRDFSRSLITVELLKPRTAQASAACKSRLVRIASDSLKNQFLHTKNHFKKTGFALFLIDFFASQARKNRAEVT